MSNSDIDKGTCIKVNVDNKQGPVKSYIPQNSDSIVFKGALDSVIVKDNEVVVVPKPKKVKPKVTQYKSALSEDNIAYSVDKVRLKCNHYVNDVQGSLGVTTIFGMLAEEPYIAMYRSKRKEKLWAWDKDNGNIFDTLKNTYKFSHVVKTGVSYYRDNYYITDLNANGQECSFWLGVGHNSTKKIVCGDYTKVDVTLEYNPNKCAGSFILEFILDNIIRPNKFVEVKSFDLAIDLFNVNILDLNLLRADKRRLVTIDNCGDDKTFYLGKRNSNGHIKIYNKLRELEAKNKDTYVDNGQEDYVEDDDSVEDNAYLEELGLELVSLQELSAKTYSSKLNDMFAWTRYEVTVKPNHYVETIADEIYLVDVRLFAGLLYCNNFTLDNTGLKGVDKWILRQVLKYPEELQELKKDSRSKYKKIEQLLRQSCSVCFDFKAINNVISNFFKTLILS